MEKFLIFYFPNRLSVRKAGKEKKVKVLTPLLSECQINAALVLESGCKSRTFRNNKQIY